ncbi:FecCD family ABC transporter permease [Propionicimonas sp.]|uniref:FecCD family ABC transporter permease n=1 Tax=Propionicimonas sp. TaxID=1955623 RepID=UPI0039E69C48
MSGAITHGAVTRAWRSGLRRRTVAVSAVLVAVMLALFVLALLLGAAGLTPAEVWSAFTGTASRSVRFVVLELRLPRALAAVLVGVCLGLAGAVFQSVLRNPLASPDVLGVTGSAGAAGVWGVLALRWSGLSLSLLAIAGGVLGALLIAGITWRRGISGLRLVLVGVGVAAFAGALTSYLLTTSDLRDAASAYTWLVGSLNGIGWPVVAVTAGLATLAAVALVPQLRGLRALELGDDTATALGIRPDRTRALVLLTAVVLAAVAVGAAGPLSFVALMAPQVARRLVGRTSLSLVASAAIGGALVTGSDLLAQHAFPSVTLPAGVVTGVVGAPYLAWQLARNDSVRRPGGSS